jgi:hypothetical protein
MAKMTSGQTIMPNRPEDPHEGQEAERALRLEVSIRVDIRKQGLRTAKASLVNISATGFKIECSLRLSPGDQLQISLPNLRPKLATVKWTEEFHLGCEFDEPLSDYAFEALIANAGS